MRRCAALARGRRAGPRLCHGGRAGQGAASRQRARHRHRGGLTGGGVPLILTFGLDSHTFGRVEAARQRWFPPARNFIPAHLTMFQQLPEAHLSDILATLAQAAGETPRLPFRVGGLTDYGTGVAYALTMPGFTWRHRTLRDGWRFALGRQDRRDRTPHITVQNKAGYAATRRCLAALDRDFAPWEGMADRFLLWHYRGGPWERIAAIPLSATDMPVTGGPT
ncbi:2'-5' RNA ligase family protein [Rhodobacteraceae bacterium CCMM004]|nr:2'-5' RNA ligase family protein [Rhodobacteraceae bacterium CCMM004]